jgi:hypothetical protein
MKFNELSEVMQGLQSAEVRFLVVGGLAVVAHGHTRVTHDLDLVLAMDPKNLESALRVLAGQGFSPRLPVKLEAFADEATRRTWIAEKGLQVFSLTSDRYRTLVIDLFAEEPFDFDTEWARAAWIPFPDPALRLPFVCREALIAMKEVAGRPVDTEDVAHLRYLQDDEA